jgi:NAD(P)-dependent dehydrogenase (short-subunit alcohol dehydrogenase family)
VHVSLEGRVAWVTGSSSGNGRAIARRLAADGAAVLCSDVRPDPDPRGFDEGPPTHEVIAATGGRAAFIECDVTDPAAVAAAAARCETEFGRLDVCVANAGVAARVNQPILEESYETYQRMMGVNADGVWHTCKAAAARMVERGEGGRIVVISSIAGLNGIESSAAYVVSKHGVMGLVRVLARQLAPHRININAVNPGYIRTAMCAESFATPEGIAALQAKTPFPRLGEPEDVAGAVSFLASDDASWVTGIALPVDGGYTAV